MLDTSGLGRVTLPSIPLTKAYNCAQLSSVFYKNESKSIYYFLLLLNIKLLSLNDLFNNDFIGDFIKFVYVGLL